MISSKCNRPDIRVACILDEFSYEGFKYECQLEQLRKKTWKDQIDSLDPHFLLVESAWRGVDKEWQRQLGKLEHNPKSQIYELLDYCNKKEIKTVFWNKEDPSNYNHFIGAATLFDFIFTTDLNCIQKYYQDIGHRQVYVLPFAAQPFIHNPIDSCNEKKGNVAFAGSWYAAKHAERRIDLYTLLETAKEFGLTIFNRNYNRGARDFEFPKEFNNYIVGSLSYPELIKALKLFKVCINVNTEKNSPTMCSRRVFELLASGTNVISNYSKSIEEMFGPIVPLCNSREDIIKNLSLLLKNYEYSRRLGQLGIRAVYEKHLYKHRFKTIVGTLGLEEDSCNTEGVSIITITKREDFIDNIFENYQNQLWNKKELVIVLNNNYLNIDKWEQRAQEYSNVIIYKLKEEKTLGECLNFGIEKAGYEYISKFDDDDFYAPNFLNDLMYAFNYADADIVGKKTYYGFIEGKEILALRFPDNEHRFTNFLSSSAFIVKRKVFDKVKFLKFTIGVETTFLKECIKFGLKLYTADKYNYVRVRHNRSDHKWVISEEEFLKRCEIIIPTKNYKEYVTV